MIDRLRLIAWIDSEPSLELPVSRETLEKAMRLGALHVEEQSRRERAKIEKCNQYFLIFVTILTFSYRSIAKTRRSIICLFKHDATKT